MRILLQTFSTMGRSIEQFEPPEAGIELRPKLAGIFSDGFSARARSVHDGREAMQAMRGEVRQRIPGRTR